MTRTGRPPKPVEVKRRAGNPGGRRLPAPMVALQAAPPDGPEPPGHLDESGRAFWVSVWRAGAAWLSPALDVPLVEEVCALSDEIADHRSDISKLGRLRPEPIVTPTGKVVGHRIVPNPALMSLRRAEESRRRGLIELGFSPTARARLGLAQVVIATQQSKLEALIESRERKAAGRRR